MKLIYTNEAYIQFKDLLLIINSADSYPIIFLELLNNKEFIKQQKLNDFIKFDNFNIIEYLKTVDWIIDYHEYENLDEVDLLKKIENSLEELNRTVNIYMVLDDSENMKIKYFKKSYQKLENKIGDLKEVLLYKNKKSNLKFPHNNIVSYTNLN